MPPARPARPAGPRAPKKGKFKPPSGPVPRPGNKGNFNALPPQLRDEIAKFKSNDFGRDHFREVKRRKGFMRRKVPVAEMLRWQKAPLKNPLLSKSSKLKKDCLNNFKNILAFMGDSSSKKSKDSLQKAIIQKGLQKPELCDEIYCQLCKQTTQNENEESCDYGWKLLTICVSAFQTTAGFQDFVLHHFVKAQSNGTRIAKLLSPYCYWRLTRTIKDRVGLPTPPNLKRINEMISNGIKPHQVYFGGNLHYMMNLESSDTNVPAILPKLFQMVKEFGGLNAMGIFRKSASQFDVDTLKKNIETKGKFLVPKEDPHTPASLIKIWLRELDVPLIPPALYDDCLTKRNAEDCMEILDVLPQDNYDALAFLLTEICEFSQYESTNKMNATNLAIVFAPNILKSISHDDSQLMRQQEKEQLFMTNLVLQWAIQIQSN